MLNYHSSFFLVFSELHFAAKLLKRKPSKQAICHIVALYNLNDYDMYSTGSRAM